MYQKAIKPMLFNCIGWFVMGMACLADGGVDWRFVTSMFLAGWAGANVLFSKP